MTTATAIRYLLARAIDRHSRTVSIILTVVGVVLAGAWGLAGAASKGHDEVDRHDQADSVRLAIAYPLPKMGGANLEVKAVEVNYAPGGSSVAHSHPCPVLAYVTKGSIRSQVDAEAETVYRAGEVFYEAPNGVHRVSANASQAQPAQLIAFFVCDHPTPLTTAIPDARDKK